MVNQGECFMAKSDAAVGVSSACHAASGCCMLSALLKRQGSSEVEQGTQ